MFPELEKMFESIRAVRDCPAVRRLLFDCWTEAQANGEAAGLSMAAVVLEGAKRYQAHEDSI